jgi:hypothetical protein
LGEAEPQTMPALPPAAASTGKAPATVPGYDIVEELARGGMGVEYKARHIQLNRLVALKMILAGGHAGEQELARFRTEAQAIARLQHPSIVQIYDVGECNGLPYFALEFCAAGSLDDWLDGTPLPALEAARLVEPLARAMQAAHHAGIVHRDLKPANVLLASGEVLASGGCEPPESALRSGGLHPPLASRSALAQYTPKITDFGLAKKLDGVSGQTASGTILGTPSYMAPEQAGGRSKEVGPAADIYALGAILYELVTGRPPFKAATSLDTVLQVVSEEPVPPSRLQSKLPRDLETICLKCLQKDPAARYASAAALAEDLRRFLAGEPIQARPSGLLARAGRWLRRTERIRDAGVIILVHALIRTVVALFFLASSIVKFHNDTLNLEAGLLLLYVAGLGIIQFWVGWRTLEKNLVAIWIGLFIALFYLGTKLAFVPITLQPRSDSEFFDPVRILNPVMLYTIFAVVQAIACVVALVAFRANRDANRVSRGG